MQKEEQFGFSKTFIFVTSSDKKRNTTTLKLCPFAKKTNTKTPKSSKSHVTNSGAFSEAHPGIL